MAKKTRKQPRSAKTFSDYDAWPIKTLAVNRLKLDPENPRLATAITRPPQIKLIEELVEHEGVLDLARSIAQQGYFPNELLVVYREAGGTIVVEGNRRLAALKLLQNPDLAPSKHGKRVRTLADMCRNKITKVPVIISPSREAAIPLIIARHDGEAVKKWTPLMQARFVQGLIDQGLSIADVAAQTGLGNNQVLRHFRNSKLSDVIQSLEIPEAVREIVGNPRKFPFSTLERLVDYSAVKTALMLETSEEEGFVTGLEREPFVAALTYIVTDIANGNVDSRSHNKANQVTSYIKDMWSNIGKKKRSSGTKVPASAFIDPSRPAKTNASKKKKPTTRIPKLRNTLMPKKFAIEVRKPSNTGDFVRAKSLAARSVSECDFHHVPEPS